MSKKYEDLKELLLELFQLDQPDLDFGLYRVLAVRRDEIVRYLDRDLRGQVSAAFAGYRSADKTELEQQLQVAIGQAQQLGADPDSLPRVKDLRERLRTQVVDVAGLEADVYNHLFRFFRRYYSEGDFLSKRVYKKDTYAIPYEGEEVMLHWANKDQYYIKTSEYLKDYAFRLRPDDAKKPMRVHFRLADVAEGEHGNAKAVAGKDRRFQLAGDDAIGVENGELIIRFNYQPSDLAQKVLNDAAAKAVMAAVDPALKPWIALLQQPTKRKDGTEGPSRLRTHLDRYTARNTVDYFIHKDLGGFLRRELDFYIKNEVMHLDDIESATAPRVEQYLSKLRAMRAVAQSIIQFLAQIEEFQKALWLKKKIVVETSWCVRAGLLSEGLLEQVAENEAQRKEWVELCGIDGMQGDLASPGYSVPLSVEFLKVNPGLMVDTRHFWSGFTEELLAGLGDVDEVVDGVLFQGENFQALELMAERYREQVKCIYIDPPYNTGDGDFPYKDSYRTSSWLTMMRDRLALGREVLLREGTFVAHIDEHEFRSLEELANLVFGASSNVGPIIWDKRNPKGDARGIAGQHEYLTWLVKDPAVLASEDARLRRPKENAQQIIEKAVDVLRQNGGVNERSRTVFREWLRQQPFSGGELAYNQLDEVGEVYRHVSMAWPNKTTAPEEYYRPLIHPLTNRPCPVPERGWRNPPGTMARLLGEGLILFGPDHTTQPTRKYLLRENMHENVPSLLYFGGSDDDLQKNMGFRFPNPKPVRLAQYITTVTVRTNDRILDFFAGSGTTGHAVINLNREDGGRRKFILAEINTYFDTVLLPRLKKVTFTPEWKDGKPKRLATPEETDRAPRLLKVVRLESYEDTLNNLDLRRTQAQQTLLDAADADPTSTFSSDYRLQYMLQTESRGSPSLLNIAAFADPTAYTLDVKVPGSDETQRKAVDLLETFNWLLGLTVRTIEAPEIYAATFDANAEGRVTIKQFRPDPTGPYWFRRVTGVLRDERKVLIIWRKQTGNPTHDNIALDEYGRKLNLNTLDSEFDLVYVNGGNNLQNLRHPDDTWKVRLIEEEFQRLMFATEGV